MNFVSIENTAWIDQVTCNLIVYLQKWTFSCPYVFQRRVKFYCIWRPCVVFFFQLHCCAFEVALSFVSIIVLSSALWVQLFCADCSCLCDQLVPVNLLLESNFQFGNVLSMTSVDRFHMKKKSFIHVIVLLVEIEKFRKQILSRSFFALYFRINKSVTKRYQTLNEKWSRRFNDAIANTFPNLYM